MPEAIGSRGRALEGVLVVGGFLIVTLVMTYPLVRHLGTALPSDLGDPLLNAWILAWGAERLLDGARDLWQAPIFFPYANTLAYSEHLLGITLLVAPVQWLSGNPLLTYNVAFLLSYVLAGSGMYLLVRSLTGRPAAGVVAGTAFAFCPYRAAQLPHLQMLMTGWMPIALWALHRYYASGQRRLLLVFAGAFTLQGLSNGYYLYFFAVAVAIVALDGLFRTRLPVRRLLVDLGTCAVLIGLALAPIIYIYYDVRQDQAFVRSYDEILQYSPDVTAYLHVRPGLMVWSDVLRHGRAEGELFAGATVMVLASLALLTNWRRRAASEAPALRPVAAVYALLALAALLLSFGPVIRYRGDELLQWGPYGWLMSLVPGLDGLRVPGRFAMIVYLSASVLAGIAAARLLPRRSPVAAGVVAAMLSLLILAEGAMAAIPYHAIADHLEPEDAPGYAWLADRPRGALLELPMNGREASPRHSLLFQYRTLEHGHPIVNGFSGYLSPLSQYLAGPGTPLVDLGQTRDVLRALRQIGVRFIALHPRLYASWEEGQTLLAALQAHDDQIAHRFSTETMHIFELRPIAPPARWRTDQLQAIPYAAMTVEASHAPDRLTLLADGDPGTRWLTGVRQTGGEWITLRFSESRRLGRVRFEVAPRSSGDYARRLRIEVSRDGETFDSVAWEDAVLPGLMGGIARSSGAVFIDIDLPALPVRAIRLVQLGETRVWYWSVDELSLWEVQTE